MAENVKDCCGAAKSKDMTLRQGIIYGLVPHAGCIAFIIGSILGVTVLVEFFKPLLMNPYFFYILIGVSIALATVSSAFYLKRLGLLSAAGAKRKWKYLSTMYGSTIGVNLLMFLVIFPLVANVSAAPQAATLPISAGAGSLLSDSGSLKLEVQIPCSGHAPLISGELKKISGVTSVQFSFPNIFDVQFDTSKTSKQEILSLDVFKSYPAKVLNESVAAQASPPTVVLQPATAPAGSASTGPSGGGCCGGSASSGGAGTCGGSGGGCGCGGK